MALLNVNPDLLEEKANRLNDARVRDEELMREMRTLVMNLNEIWKGSAQDAFVQKFLSQQRSMDDLQSTLKDFIREARKTATEARNLDNNLLALIRRMLSSFF